LLSREIAAAAAIAQLNNNEDKEEEKTPQQHAKEEKDRTVQREREDAKAVREQEAVGQKNARAEFEKIEHKKMLAAFFKMITMNRVTQLKNEQAAGARAKTCCGCGRGQNDGAHDDSLSWACCRAGCNNFLFSVCAKSLSTVAIDFINKNGWTCDSCKEG
jgi:hypothetical protein